MKSSSLSQVHSRLARHQERAAGRPRFLPRTDYQFQVQAEDVTPARQTHPAARPAELRAFRNMTNSYLADDAERNRLLEIAVFALVAAGVAWPLISLLVVLAQTARG